MPNTSATPITFYDHYLMAMEHIAILRGEYCNVDVFADPAMRLVTFYRKLGRGSSMPMQQKTFQVYISPYDKGTTGGVPDYKKYMVNMRTCQIKIQKIF